MTCNPYQKLSVCSNTVDEMDMANGTMGRGEGERRAVYRVLLGNMREREHL